MKGPETQEPVGDQSIDQKKAKLEFSFHISHWHFCYHNELSKNVSLKNWLPEFE